MGPIRAPGGAGVRGPVVANTNAPKAGVGVAVAVGVGGIGVSVGVGVGA